MELRHSTAFGGLAILESTVDRFAFAPHRHDEIVIAVYRDGGKAFRCGREDGVALRGDILAIGPGTLHSAKTLNDCGWNYVSLYFKPDQAAAALSKSVEEILERIGAFAFFDRRAALARNALAALDAGTGQELALSEFLIDLLATDPARRSPCGRPASKLCTVFERIMDDPADRIRLDDLATLAGMSPEHLSRRFKAEFGVSPFQLLSFARAQRAKAKIAAGAGLADAAAEAGFSDQSHMTRWFNRIYGIAPGRFARYQ